MLRSRTPWTGSIPGREYLRASADHLEGLDGELVADRAVRMARFGVREDLVDPDLALFGVDNRSTCGDHDDLRLRVHRALP